MDGWLCPLHCKSQGRMYMYTYMLYTLIGLTSAPEGRQAQTETQRPYQGRDRVVRTVYTPKEGHVPFHIACHWSSARTAPAATHCLSPRAGQSPPTGEGKSGCSIGPGSGPRPWGVFSSGRPGSDTPAPVEPDATANQTLQVGFKEKAKENVKTATYGSVIVIGVGITAVVLYTVFSELFSSSSPVKLFQMASEKCVQHPRVQDLLGEPIKAFGEETRRGRRRHVSHVEYVDKEGRKGIRVQFYLQGLRKRGTAQIDAREVSAQLIIIRLAEFNLWRACFESMFQDESGSMKTRFIIVTADDLLATSVVVEDNR
eukprot:TCALIF_13304-PA protein Name:"Similar to timm21 Mitochondrial import inner membrane translocase subunit Tim21 (Xenopus laevis)" AED:0.25 eAED:0.37 QI:0/0/0/0.5/1/1/4/0/313